MNFYLELKKNLIRIKQDLLEILEKRKIIVRKRKNNDFQVHWDDNSEKPYLRIILDYELIIEKYLIFQNGIGKEINELLSKSTDRKHKSILNLIKKEIWFDPKVHSKFIKENNKYYRSYRGDKQEDFIEESDLDKAKIKMIDICRKELIESFLLKYDSVLIYLENESEWLSEIIQQTLNKQDKSSKIYKYGFNILEDEPTIAMILLGVALECQMKIKYNLDILDKDTLGTLIGKLKKTKKYPNLNYKLLNEINIKYIKAKHEKTSIIPLSEVEPLYQKAIIFF